jgi:hypothetical protein
MSRETIMMYFYYALIFIICVIQLASLLHYFELLGTLYETFIDCETVLNITLLLVISISSCVLMVNLKSKHPVDFKLLSTFITVFMISECGCLIFYIIENKSIDESGVIAYSIFASTGVRSIL